jgi:hypothetical protein
MIQHEMVQGLSGEFPEISGFVMTSVKESSLVEVILTSPSPSTAENATILAAWTYGLGKTAVFTTDAGRRWATPWTSWDGYDRFFSQLVRWSMRPSGEEGKFSVATDVEGTKTRVVITAIDQDDEYLNYQTLTGTVLGPNMESIPLDIDQSAPGRYVGEFDSTSAGSYMVLINPGSGQGMIRTGVNVGYSDEFRDQETNMPLLESLASLKTKRGEAGIVRRSTGGRSVPPRHGIGRFEPRHLAVAGNDRKLFVPGRRVRAPRTGKLRMAHSAVASVCRSRATAPAAGGAGRNHEPPPKPQGRGWPSD